RTRRYRQTLRTVMNKYPSRSVEGAFLSALDSKIVNYRRSIHATERVLHELQARLRVSAVLTVYESLPLSVMAGRWATNKGVPWVGFFPILVGDRPDGNHFPAPAHLVYGDQLRDKMIFHGCAPESMQVVGTPTFDVTPHRDIASDQTYLARLFPHIVGRKLVVVATEAFAHPLIELEPVLRALADMEDVAVVLKVHPSDSELFFSNFVDSLGNASNIRVIQKCELLPLLHVGDLLIAVVSNIIVTAAALGTPTLVC